VIPVGPGYLKKKPGSKKTTGSRHLKIFRIKEPLVLDTLRKNQIQRTAGSGYFEKNQIQRTAGSGYFKNFKEPFRFHERTGKDWTVLGGYLKRLENHGYVQ
jgi:hypothetical protein